MGKLLDAVKLVMLGGEPALPGDPVIDLGNGPGKWRGEAVFGMTHRMHQPVARLPQAWRHIRLQLQGFHGL